MAPETALVTIGLGGNDYALFGSLILGCVQAARTDPTGEPCTEMVEEASKRSIARIRDRLVELVRAVHDRAPTARILLVGYPQVFPESEGCEQLPLAAGDVPLAHATVRSLNGAVSSAAHETGAEYVDVWAASAGHDICAAEPWAAGAAPQRTDGPAYHPLS